MRSKKVKQRIQDNWWRRYQRFQASRKRRGLLREVPRLFVYASKGPARTPFVVTGWDDLKKEFGDHPHTTMMAVAPREEPARVLSGVTPGIYPVR